MLSVAIYNRRLQEMESAASSTGNHVEIAVSITGDHVDLCTIGDHRLHTNGSCHFTDRQPS